MEDGSRSGELQIRLLFSTLQADLCSRNSYLFFFFCGLFAFFFYTPISGYKFREFRWIGCNFLPLHESAIGSGVTFRRWKFLTNEPSGLTILCVWFIASTRGVGVPDAVVYPKEEDLTSKTNKIYSVANIYLSADMRN